MDRLFAGMYEADIKSGRPSIAPQKLPRAMLIQVLYSIRSERQPTEQVRYNLLFRWFIGLAMDDLVWVPTVFTKNRERLIKHDWSHLSEPPERFTGLTSVESFWK